MTAFSNPIHKYMSAPVHTIQVSADLQEAERRMRALNISSLAVVADGEELIGVISRTDLLGVGRMNAEGHGPNALLRLPHAAVGSVMNTRPICVGAGDTVAHAARLLCEHSIHRVFVTLAGRSVGVLTTKDILRVMKDARIPAPISAFMSSPVITVDVDTTVGQATDLLGTEKIHGLLVVENEWPVGVFTQVEALLGRDLPAKTMVEEVMSYGLLCMDQTTPAFRAAGCMVDTQARSLIAIEGRQVRGILTAIDLCRAALVPIPAPDSAT